MIQSIPFGKKTIGPGHPVILIAEIGVNHEGNAETCYKMIEVAKSAGVDAVKLQTIDPEENYTPDTESYKIFKASQLSQDETTKAFELARNIGLEVFSTIGDLKTFSWIEKLSPAAYKVSSGLLTHTPLIFELAKSGKPILISTGMGEEKEIQDAISTAHKAKNDKIGLFQCTSQYPTPIDMVNLNSIASMCEKYYVPVGFSDHTIGEFASVLSVAAGACMIEKHFTLDRSRVGYDHHISLDAEGLKSLVDNVRMAECLLGSKEKKKTPEQHMASNAYSRSIVANKQIEPGEIIKPDSVCFMRTRPEHRGLPPGNIKQIIGKRSKIKLSRYTAITFDNIE